MTQRSASGWYLEVDDVGGYTHTATPLTGEVEPSRNPKANARPEITIPVPKNGKWDAILGDGSADIDLRLWKDGVRQPIDTLEDVTQQPGYTQLEASGGIELRTRVETAFDQKAIHLAAQDLIDTETTTPYTSNVDTPTTTTETNTQIDSWTDAAEFRNRLEPLPQATDPIEVTDPGGVAVQQTAFHFDARNNSGGGADSLNTSQGGSSDWVDGFAARLDAVGEFVEVTVTFNHNVPSDNVGFAVRQGADDSPEIEYRIGQGTGDDFSGELVDRIDNTGSTQIVFGWDQMQDVPFGTSGGYTGGDLIAGETYTFRIECTARDTGEEIGIDWVVPHDTGADGRFTANYTFDNTTDGNNELSGPEKFPESVRAPFRQIPAPQAVTGAKAVLTVNEGSSPSGAFSIRLSNDQGANFTTNSNSDTFETDSLGTAWGPSVLLEVDLSRFGTQTETPTSGISGHEVTDVTLSADLETMPIVVNRAFDGHLDGVLKELADIGDFLWGLSWDTTNSRIAVEWTKPGQRTTTNDPTPADYTATKSTASVYQKAAVYGQSDVQVQGERFESNHGTAVPLANDRIQEGGSVLVRDPDTGQRFREGADYTLDYQAGEITTLAGGSMSNTAIFEIDYFYQAFGEFTKSGVGSPAEAPPAELPGLPSDFLCRQAARLIIDEVEHPLHTAEVILPNDETGWSVVESFDPDIVPTGGNALHVKDVQNTPEGTVLTLGSRRSFGEVVDDIRAQVSAVSRKA